MDIPNEILYVMQDDAFQETGPVCIAAQSWLSRC